MDIDVAKLIDELEKKTHELKFSPMTGKDPE
jgi:hypothetical protein